MRIYMAPMEGLTGYVFRNAYEKHFGQIDKYFTPFIASTGLNHKELNDILPEHNEGLFVVPQVLCNKAEDFILIAKKLKDFGYEEINFNLGCPSGTVVAKGRGAGFLSKVEELDAFLDTIYKECDQKISIKTRVGLESEEEWERLLEVYNQYPLEELIIHPRVQKDFYKNPIRKETYKYAMEHSKAPLCYNGEIHSRKAYDKFTEEFPEVHTIMLGRGLFKNPFLVEEIRGVGAERIEGSCEQKMVVKSNVWDEKEYAIRRTTLRAFHEDVLQGYKEIMSGDTNTLFKMKEIWTYLSESFPGSEKQIKKLRKVNNLAEYKAIVNEIFRL